MENQDPSTSLGSASFGLIDEKLLRDTTASLINVSSDEKRVTDKPPKPFRTPTSIERLGGSQEDLKIAAASEEEDDENDETQTTVHLEEEMANELIDDDQVYSSSSDEEEEENDEYIDKENNRPTNPRQFALSVNKSNFSNTQLNDLTNVSSANFYDFDEHRFKPANNDTCYVSNLMDESSNILRNSAEFDTTNDKMNRSNENAAAANGKSPTKRRSTSAASSKPAKSRYLYDDDSTFADENEVKLEVKSGSNEQEQPKVDFDRTREDRLSQIIQQAIERRKQSHSQFNEVGNGDLKAIYDKLSIRNETKDIEKKLMDTSINANNYSNWQLNDTLDILKGQKGENDLSLTNASKPSDQTYQIDKKEKNTTITTANKPASTTMIEGELPSMYFKPGSDESLRFSNQSSASVAAAATASQLPTQNPFDFGEDQMAMQAQAAFLQCSGFGIGAEDTAEFRDAEQCLADLAKDEAQNRKEFADNNLTIDTSQSTTHIISTSSSSSSSDETSNSKRRDADQKPKNADGEKKDKWWLNANQVLQTSKLELSASSINSSDWMDSSVSSGSSANAHNSQRPLVKIPAVDYFSKRSTMPDICQAESDVDINVTVRSDNVNRATTAAPPVNDPSTTHTINLNDSQDKTICEDKGNRPETAIQTPRQKASGENNEDDTTNITFSSLATPGQTTRENFSFTFNTDPEKGPFLLEKPKKPLVLSPMEPVKEPKQTKTATTTTTSALNFKTLQNELDNVTNRLASSDRTKPTSEKETKKSTTTPSSFTSTPTRLPKSHGGNREDNKGDRDSSSRSSVSNTAASNKADLFNQESFLSSIPAGDDTTLLSSSIHRMHRKLRQKNTSNVQSSTAISSPTKQSSSRHHHSHHNKHSKSSNQRVGIVDEQDDENDESNNRLTLTSVSSAAVSSTSGSGASGGGMGAVGSSAVSSSTASPSETLTNSANSLHLHRSASQVSSGNIMPNYMTNTNMGPVMYVPFVPLNSQFLQQPSAAAAASASHHMAAHMSAMASVNGSLVTPNIPGSNISSFAGGFSSAPTLPSHHPSFLSAPNQAHSHLYQTPPTTDLYGNTPTTSYQSLNAQQQSMMRQQLSSSNMNLTSNVLPKIEFEPANVDFGPIAEGCFTQLVVFLKLANLEALSNLESASIEVELMSAPDWAIEPVETATTDSTTRQSKSANLLLKKLNKDVIRCALDQTLSLVNSTDSPKSDGANKLTFGPPSRYHQFYVRLDTRNLNMIRDLVAQLDAAAVEMLEPIRIQTYALVHLILGPPHALKRYALDRIELRFVLGYAKLRSSEEIEFTLPSDKAAASSGNSNQPIISEQVVTLTNIGNVHVDVDCFLTSTSSNTSSLSSKKHAQQSIRFGEFELRVDEALLSLAPRAQSRQSTRLLLMHRLQHKGEDDRIARLSTPTIDPADLDGVRLMFEVSPSGAKHVIPIKFKLPEKRIKAPRISSNRTILFFGSTLNPSSRSNTDMGTGLHDEFAICNPNKIRCTYKLSVVEEPEGSFTFVLVDKVCKAPTRLTPQCNELEIVLEPGMEIRIGVRFNRYNIDQDIVVGSIRIEVREGEEKQGFCMELVGFQFETALDVVDSRSRMSDKRSSQEAASTNKSLLEKLKCRSTKYSKLSLDLLGSSRSHSYKKNVQLKNKSSIFKCIVYPVLFDTRSGKEIQLATAPKKSQIAEIGFDLSEGARLRLAALDRMINFNDGMIWIELKKGEEAGIQIEYTSNNASAGDRIDTVRLCFFYSEYDLAAYAAYNFVQSNLRYQTAARDKEFIDVLTSRLLFNSELMQNGELLCSSSMNESTVSRLNYKPSSTFANAAANVSMNCSTMSEDTTIVNVNTSTLMTRLGTKPRHFREDYLRLFRQSIKCTFLMFTLAQNDQLLTSSSSVITSIDEKRTRLPAITSTTSDSNLLSRRSETLAISSMMSKKPSDQQHRSSLSSDEPPALSSAQESWKLTPSQLRLTSSTIKTITIRNKLLRKQLEYHVKFRPEYLVVEPSKGTLNELGFAELQVRVAPSAAATLRDTWQGTISVWCNLVQKDVQVTIEVPSQIGQTSIIEQRREFDASTPASSTIRRRGSTFEPDSIEPCVEMPSSLANGCSDLEPSSIDSLMTLTPLISASLTPRFINSFSTTALSSTNSSSLASVTPLSSSSASSISKDFTSSFSYGVKMQKMPNNENCWMVNFPPVQLHQTHSFEITLTNPTPLYVNWKAFSEGPATIKLDDIDKSCASASSSSSTLSLFENVVKSSCAAFSMSPQSGSIPPMKTQMIRLAFSPRQACGLYQQTWFVETRADASSVSSMFDSKSSSSLHSFSTISRTDYQCKIMLSGKAVAFTDSLSRPKDESTNRLPKDSESRSSKGMLSQTNSSMSSTLSSSASTTSSQKSSNLKEGLHFKSNVIKFGKVAPNEKVRLEMEIKNHDEFIEHKLSVVPGLQPPFYVGSRHAFEVNVVQPKHFIRIPVEFRPQVPGRYADKILVKTDQKSNPNIFCELNAECAP